MTNPNHSQSLREEIEEILDNNGLLDKTHAELITDAILQAVHNRIPKEVDYPETMEYVEMVKKAGENGKYDDMYDNGWNAHEAATRKELQ